MYKILAVILVLGAAALVIYFVAGNRGVETPGTEEAGDVDAGQVEEALKETSPRTVYGSCNAISTSSNCIDYVGSMWNDNDSGKLNCGDSGTFSENACPYSKFGGCQTSGGTVMEIIAWVYEEGPGEYNEESVPYARMACDALANAQWVTPEELLQ